MMVSYTRARAEGLGIDCNVGIMQRTERIVYIGVFSVFNFVGNLISSALGFKPDDYLLKFALIVVLAFSLYTSIERMVYVMRKLREKEFKK
jgi:phosphatidylglycerophosphate synthase